MSGEPVVRAEEVEGKSNVLIRSFRDSEAWLASHELTLAVYRATTGFPKNEMFGLTSQIRRSSASVGANLAEGFGRHSKRELRRFCLIASGSLQETMNFIELAKDLGFWQLDAAEQLSADAARVGRLLGGLERSLDRAEAAAR